MDYSVIFFCIFCVITFITTTVYVMNLVVSLMVFSLLIALLFLRFSHEYLAFTYLIIYFGAVIMLFVFIVMMLDINNVFEHFSWQADLNMLFVICLMVKIVMLAYSFLKGYKQDHGLDFSAAHHSTWTTSLSTVDAFIMFFNFYWVWLCFIGLLMLVVVIGLVHALMDCRGEIVSLYEDQKKNKNL